MSVGLIALHYPHAAHHAEFVSRVRHVVEVMRATPGCVAADCWESVDGDAVVSVGQWQSAAAQASSFAAARAAGADFAYDDREVRPRQLVHLTSPTDPVAGPPTPAAA